MVQTLQNTNKEEWLKVLGKGMITLPKKWREEMGIENGDVVRAKKEGDKVVIEAQSLKSTVPYRVYTSQEISEFLQEDAIPDTLRGKVMERLTMSSERRS